MKIWKLFLKSLRWSILDIKLIVIEVLLLIFLINLLLNYKLKKHFNTRILSVVKFIISKIDRESENVEFKELKGYTKSYNLIYFDYYYVIGKLYMITIIGIDVLTLVFVLIVFINGFLYPYTAYGLDYALLFLQKSATMYIIAWGCIYILRLVHLKKLKKLYYNISSSEAEKMLYSLIDFQNKFLSYIILKKYKVNLKVVTIFKNNLFVTCSGLYDNINKRVYKFSEIQTISFENGMKIKLVSGEDILFEKEESNYSTYERDLMSRVHLKLVEKYLTEEGVINDTFKLIRDIMLKEDVIQTIEYDLT